MANEHWVVFFNTHQVRGVESRRVSEEAALIRARSCLRRQFEVSKFKARTASSSKERKLSGGQGKTRKS